MIKNFPLKCLQITPDRFAALERYERLIKGLETTELKALHTHKSDITSEVLLNILGRLTKKRYCIDKIPWSNALSSVCQNEILT